MKKIKNEDLANALLAIDNSQLFKSGKILEKEYDGYVSSIGASVINAGLLPTLSFYTDIHKRSDQVRRYKLLKVIFAVMDSRAATQANNVDNGLLNYVLKKVYGPDYDRARPGSLGNPSSKELATQKKRFLEAAVAVKLAMRNYQHSDSSNS